MLSKCKIIPRKHMLTRGSVEWRMCLPANPARQNQVGWAKMEGRAVHEGQLLKCRTKLEGMKTRRGMEVDSSSSGGHVRHYDL
jgi:hypothetical protein